MAPIALVTLVGAVLPAVCAWGESRTAHRLVLAESGAGKLALVDIH